MECDIFHKDILIYEQLKRVFHVTIHHVSAMTLTTNDFDYFDLHYISIMEKESL
jgi:hypothetical protein